MRTTYRSKGVREYWAARWEEIRADASMENIGVYPLKYAEMTVKHRDGRILEAGCGAGRILRYYHDRGYDIVGIDFIDAVIEKLKATDHSLQVAVGDVTHLSFEDASFDYVLAFVLYHNLEHGLDNAIQETYRILKPGGTVCASFRADNLTMRLTDWLAERRDNTKSGAKVVFHKMNLTRTEYESIFLQAGFHIDFVAPVENMPILYKFRLFRAARHKKFDENKARLEGYQLSWLGQRLQSIMMRHFPDQFCNVYVLIARKAD